MIARPDGTAFVVGRFAQGPAGNDDAWLLGLDASGEPTFSRTLGGFRGDVLVAVTSTRDGGVVAAGWSSSFGPTADSEAWVVKLDVAGAVLWQRSLGAGNREEMAGVVDLPSGIVAVGRTNDGDRDAWLLGLDASGNLSWGTAIGGLDQQYVTAAAAAPDGNLVLVGSTWLGAARSDDAWIVEVSPPASIVWQVALGGSMPDDARAVMVLPDSSVVVGGRAGASGRTHPLVARLDAAGGLLWQRTWDVSGEVEALALRADGALLAVGSAERAWAVVLDQAGNELAQTGLDAAHSWLAAAGLAGGGLALAGSGAGATASDAVIAVLDADLAVSPPCVTLAAPYPPVTLGLTLIPTTYSARSLGASALDGTGILQDVPVTRAIACPMQPAEPEPVRVRSQAPGVVLSFPEPAAAEAFNVHEGAIGGFLTPGSVRCWLRLGDPGVVREAGGTIAIAHDPASADAWFLVSASNVAGESGLGASSDGPRDEPPSAWRCGASP